MLLGGSVGGFITEVRGRRQTPVFKVKVFASIHSSGEVTGTN